MTFLLDPVTGCCLNVALRNFIFCSQFSSPCNILYTFSKTIFRFVPHISYYILLIVMFVMHETKNIGILHNFYNFSLNVTKIKTD